VALTSGIKIITVEHLQKYGPYALSSEALCNSIRTRHVIHVTLHYF
jgi:hypothetical protein